MPLIDQEFHALIPPLTPEEYQQLEAKALGFSGWNKERNKFIEIIPSAAEGKYWFIQVTDSIPAIQEYTKRAINEIILGTAIKAITKGETFELQAQKSSPLPTDHFTKITTRKNTQKTTNVYFIQSVVGGPIKIGVAGNPEERMKQHQTGSPFRLKIVHIIWGVSYQTEKELHNRFANYRLHGEWFSEKILGLLDGVGYENR